SGPKWARATALLASLVSPIIRWKTACGSSTPRAAASSTYTLRIIASVSTSRPSMSKTTPRIWRGKSMAALKPAPPRRDKSTSVSAGNEAVGAVALEVEQRGEVGVAQLHVGLVAEDRLGAVGDAEAGGGHHVDVV